MTHEYYQNKMYSGKFANQITNMTPQLPGSLFCPNSQSDNIKSYD